MKRKFPVIVIDCLSVEARSLSLRGIDGQSGDIIAHIATDLVANILSKMVEWGRQREAVSCGIWRLDLKAASTLVASSTSHVSIYEGLALLVILLEVPVHRPLAHDISTNAEQ